MAHRYSFILLLHIEIFTTRSSIPALHVENHTKAPAPSAGSSEIAGGPTQAGVAEGQDKPETRGRVSSCCGRVEQAGIVAQTRGKRNAQDSKEKTAHEANTIPLPQELSTADREKRTVSDEGPEWVEKRCAQWRVLQPSISLFHHHTPIKGAVKKVPLSPRTLLLQDHHLPPLQE